MDELVTIVFWNVHGRDLADALGRLARAERADIVIVAENGASNRDVAHHLSVRTGRPFRRFPANSKLEVFSSYPRAALTPIEEGARFTGWKINLKRGTEFGIFALHLPSKLRQDSDDQRFSASQAIQSLASFEKRLGHRRTLVLGDFNMDPFESTMVGADGFHAVLDRSVARRNERTVHGESRHFFYNPMWSLMGDCSKGPPGSYYYSRGKVVTPFWHMFDQVLIRPTLINALAVHKLHIVARIGRDTLLSNNIPNAQVFSDHLPLSVGFTKSKVHNV